MAGLDPAMTIDSEPTVSAKDKKRRRVGAVAFLFVPGKLKSRIGLADRPRDLSVAAGAPYSQGPAASIVRPIRYPRVIRIGCDGNGLT